MKRMRILGFAWLLALCSLGAGAQEVAKTDTVKGKKQELLQQEKQMGEKKGQRIDSTTGRPIDVKTGLNKAAEVQTEPLLGDTVSAKPTFRVQDDRIPVFPVDRSPLHEGEYRVSGVIHDFPHGQLYGSGQQVNLIGMGVMNQAAVGYVFHPGQWTVDFRTSVVKWSVPRRSALQWGTSAAFSYPLGDKWQWDTGLSYTHLLRSPAGVIDGRTTVTYTLSPSWRLHMGVQSQMNVPSGRKHTVPVFTPSFQRKSTKIDLDLGSTLYYLLFDR